MPATLASAFRDATGLDMPSFESVGFLFRDRSHFELFFKRVLYFTCEVVEPLQRYGLSQTDRIFDAAAGSGALTLALVIRGFHQVTMCDLDEKELEIGARITSMLVPGAPKPGMIVKSVLDCEWDYDALVSFQTIEHLESSGKQRFTQQDRHFNVADRQCQRRFLKSANQGIKKLIFVNAPNLLYLYDGHDTGLPLFHWLPVGLRRRLIQAGWTRSSWCGVCQPVSVPFLSRHLPDFHLVSGYYTYPSAQEYFANVARYTYMGAENARADGGDRSFNRKVAIAFNSVLGKTTQLLLPKVSVVYKRR